MARHIFDVNVVFDFLIQERFGEQGCTGTATWYTFGAPKTVLTMEM